MSTTEAPHPLDRLDALLNRFSVRAERVHTGDFCAVRRFPAVPGRGFLHILRAGSLTVSDETGAAPRVLSEATLLFYPRPHEHAFRAEAGDGVLLDCAALDFDGGSAHPLVAALPEVVTVPVAGVSGLDGALALLGEEVADPRCGHRHVIDRLFEIVLLKLLRHLLDRPEQYGIPSGLLGGLADPEIARALVAMHERPGEPWTLDELGRTARMSRSAFAARFREAVGAAPYDYLIDWRLTVGQQLLRRGVPVAQVAAELGYTSSSFSRVFAQRQGEPPRAWAERSRR